MSAVAHRTFTQVTQGCSLFRWQRFFISLASVSLGTGKTFLQSDSKIMHFFRISHFSSDFEYGPTRGKDGKYEGSG